MKIHRITKGEHKIVLDCIDRYVDNYHYASNDFERGSTDKCMYAFLDNMFHSKILVNKYLEVYNTRKNDRD